MEFNWVILQDNGVSDRFESRKEAEAVLSEYAEGEIAYSPFGG